MKFNNPSWYSSYEENNYGDFFYALMRVSQPEVVVELGTEAGYSAYYIAQGLRSNQKGHLYCYDLWEKYDAKNYGFYVRSRSEAEENLKQFQDIVSFNSIDAREVYKMHDVVDILHVDLHNEGEILEEVIPNWIDKTRQFIIIEGGSIERDKVEWMIKYKKIPIRKWLEDFSHRREDIKYFTIEPFPSVTIIKKNEIIKN